MDSGQLTAVLIVAMIMIASIVRVKYGYRRFGRFRDNGDIQMGAQERAENLRLRDEVRELKERIKVLERITVDKENSLARQIDDLRDR
jgi:cell division protein FtsB